MTRIETVCFDLDNTLCVNEQDNEEIHQAVFEQVGRDPLFTVADVRAVDPATLPDADTLAEFYANLYGAVTDELSPDERRELAAATVEVIDETAVIFRDGAREAFEYARDRYDVGVLTQGYWETQTAKLDTLGIRDSLDAIVVCGGTDLPGKPDSGPFREVLDGLDASPETTLYVGDSLRGDVVGANTVGMQSAWIRSGDQSRDDVEPDYVLESMSELAGLL